MIQEQQILEQVAGLKTLYAMDQRGYAIAIEYVTACFEWVLRITGPDAAGEPFTVETRHANPETAWRRAVIDLQDRRLWPV